MIAVIGASGRLGQCLMKEPGTIACPVRFEQAESYKKWFDERPEITTVWHVARACRKNGTRRDHQTFNLEQRAMIQLLESRARDLRFVYASSKVVYGISAEESTPLSASTITEYFKDDQVGVYNCPYWKVNTKSSIENLPPQLTIYGLTKLFCESHIMEKCSNYKILRIWDIL